MAGTGPFDPAENADGILPSLLDVCEEAVVATDLDGAIVSWNQGAARLYGYSAEEAIGQTLAMLVPDGQRSLLPSQYSRIRAGERLDAFETRRLTKRGDQVAISETLAPVTDRAGSVVGAVSIARDLRGETRTSSALQSAQARWRALLDSAIDAIVVIDAHGRIEAFNGAAERTFGYSERELLGHNVSVLMPSPYREEHDGYIARYARGGEPRIIGTGRDVRGRRRDGSTFPLHLAVGEMRLDGERKFTGILHDLSERVALEQQLRASEARWRAIVDSAVDGIVVIAADGRIEAFNPAAERLFGYAEHEVLGENVKILMPSPYHEEHDGYLSRYLRHGGARVIGIGREVTGRRKDGSTFPVHLSVGEMHLAGERRFTGILHDLSARVAMEERLREQAALAHLGEMAAVIAHEIKNPLAGIRGAVQVVAGRLPAGAAEAKVLGDVVSRVDSLSDLMKDLLQFARPPQVTRNAVSVRSIVTATADLLAADPALQALQTQVHGDAPMIEADAGLLQTVFLNLLINGAQAMGGSGTLDISITVSDGTCAVAFRDHGPGIPPDIRDKVFTPFFTTKSRGTGLGLPTAKRFIEAHGGDMRFECPPGGGTVVTVELPIAH